MIKKPFEIEFHESVIHQAGFKVARRTAKLINKSFENFSDVYVLHNIFINSENIIDHMILYKNAIILIESRSCHGSIRISDTGTWTRERMIVVNPIQSIQRQQDVLSELLRRDAIRCIDPDVISNLIYHRIIVKSERCMLHGNQTISKLITPKDQILTNIAQIIESTNAKTRKKLWQFRTTSVPTADDLEVLTSFLRNEHYKNIPPDS